MSNRIEPGCATLTRRSREECIRELQAKFGDSFLIKDWEKVKIKNFWGKEKEECIVTYVVDYTKHNKQKEKEAFEKERNDFLKIVENQKNQKMILEKLSNLEKQVSNINVTDSKIDEHETITRLETILEINEFSNAYIKKIIKKVKSYFTIDQLDDYDAVQSKVVEWIGESISIFNEKPRTGPLVIILIGPTGVGKTTTIAKLAASCICSQNQRTGLPQKVRLITIDCYRIAAEEQISVYAESMKINYHYAKNVNEVQSVIEQNQDDDVILIDTIGFSPKDYGHIAEMRRMLDIKGVASQVFLTMAASTKTSDLLEIMQQFEIFSYHSVIVTKLDETNHIGNIISVLSEKNKSVAFFTNGQTVPQDIEPASIVKLLILLSDFKINRGRIEELFSPNHNT